eukprot:CAMPEP_0168244794 /NCGR_PEP_ID=MMETSP0140_2-20121125/24820_1 /TAXON_ID=44445 /ORGANISM="Pseudo-nitzschia australis, Strain 10249 10 AB" /LENGTH=87 /DNA_ID=CAMNT_0008180339 /DNA_START=381 /DNA_END=644 /DNA_ORIENTATION=-
MEADDDDDSSLDTDDDIDDDDDDDSSVVEESLPVLASLGLLSPSLWLLPSMPANTQSIRLVVVAAAVPGIVRVVASQRKQVLVRVVR